MENIEEELKSLADEKYREFNKKSCPDTEKEILGIRIPVLRKFAKEIIRKNDWQEIIKNIGDKYFEEIIIQGLIIGYAKCDIKQKMPYIKKFVPKIDSWAISDTFVPTLNIKEKDLDEVFNFIKPYFQSNKEFEIRFAVIMLLNYYINEKYVDEVINILDNINNNGYYAKMSVAWCLAEIRH